VAAERWVHPPVVAKEAPPAWVALWRFRLVALVVLALLVLLAVLVFRQVTGANAQDPGIDALVQQLLVHLVQRHP
jgi:hypothetical protein